MTDSPFAPLLELQQIDIRLTQIQHRLDHLPEKANRDSVESRLTAHRAVVEATEADRHIEGAEQKRLEDELATLEAKIGREDAKLYSGTIQTAKELQWINDELKLLRQRQSDFEDHILEVLDRIEPLDARLAELAVTTAELEAELQAATVALAEAEGSEGIELRTTREHRTSFVAELEPDRLALYDKMRTNVSGNAIALLNAGQCSGCHLGLPSAEIERLRRLPADEPAYCEECGALLVR